MLPYPFVTLHMIVQYSLSRERFATEGTRMCRLILLYVRRVEALGKVADLGMERAGMSALIVLALMKTLG